MVSTLEQMQVPNGTGPGVRRSKRPLLASRTRCNVLWKPPKFGVFHIFCLFFISFGTHFFYLLCSLLTDVSIFAFANSYDCLITLSFLCCLSNLLYLN